MKNYIVLTIALVVGLFGIVFLARGIAWVVSESPKQEVSMPMENAPTQTKTMIATATFGTKPLNQKIKKKYEFPEGTGGVYIRPFKIN